MKHILLLIKLVILFWKHWSRIIRFVIAIHIFDFTTHILIGSSAFHTRRRNIIDIRLNILIFKKEYKVGTSSYLFLIYYGIFRILSEIFREPDAQIGYLFGFFSMGTMLSLFMILSGFVILVIFKKKNEI